MTTDITLGNQRLLQLAEILDTADERHQERGEPGYLQSAFIHPCGSPACALGEWAAANPKTWILCDGTPTGRSLTNDYFGRFGQARIDFSIDQREYEELFGVFGCDTAISGKAASNYIRGFVARRQS